MRFVSRNPWSRDADLASMSSLLSAAARFLAAAGWIDAEHIDSHRGRLHPILPVKGASVFTDSVLIEPGIRSKYADLMPPHGVSPVLAPNIFVHQAFNGAFSPARPWVEQLLTPTPLAWYEGPSGPVEVDSLFWFYVGADTAGDEVPTGVVVADAERRSCDFVLVAHASPQKRLQERLDLLGGLVDAAKVLDDGIIGAAR